MNKWVIVKTSFPAIHRWKDAKSVLNEFLKEYHRHIFYVEFWVSVSGSDREIEFFDLLHHLNTFIEKEYKNKRFEKSCEMIGEEIIKEFKQYYKGNSFKCKVFEDDENGAFIEVD